MKINFKPSSWFILVIGFIIYLACAMNTGHTGDQSINNFVKASFTLMTTLFIWTCVQILTKSFNMKYFSWVLSISGYIFALTVFCYFGIEQQNTWFRLNGILSLSACAIAMFSTLPLLILYYKGGPSHNNQEAKQAQQSTSAASKATEDENWEPASVEDLHSGEYELEG